ncbi:hypothetical protein [Pedobacter frigoris]|uniref:hypothetical protein n=1 Tax=Pedobacter frigoris TaxID=2571272 RepID=UPI00292FBFF5|nr:hypothetical protein [Pedobacter frigoris]
MPDLTMTSRWKPDFSSIDKWEVLGMSGKPMELYVSVISEDRKEVADSKYLGLYQIPLSLPLNLIPPFS